MRSLHCAMNGYLCTPLGLTTVFVHHNKWVSRSGGGGMTEISFILLRERCFQKHSQQTKHRHGKTHVSYYYYYYYYYYYFH